MYIDIINSLLLKSNACEQCSERNGIVIVFHAFVGGKMMENNSSSFKDRFQGRYEGERLTWLFFSLMS